MVKETIPKPMVTYKINIFINSLSTKIGIVAEKNDYLRIKVV